MKSDSRAELYRRHLEGNTLAISFMTVAELYEGAFRAAWNESRLRTLAEVLKNYLVVPSTPSACQFWGQIRAQRKHRPISVDDAWIAATALAHGCPLVTHNAQDFADVPDLEVISAGGS